MIDHKNFKPLLAADATTAHLQAVLAARGYVLVSPKLDGVRALLHAGTAYSRSLKPIRNRFVQSTLCEVSNLDGELIVGSATATACYRRTVSGVMSYAGEPDFVLYAFDTVDAEGDTAAELLRHRPFEERLELLQNVEGEADGRIRVLEHRKCSSMEEINAAEQEFLAAGYEGAMVRDPEGIYKLGRSTAKQGILLKVKRHTDEEARVVGFKELQHNDNPLQTNELGYATRSSHRANMVRSGTLGALEVEADSFEETFSIGTGFTDEQRKEIWENKDSYKGRLVKFKHLAVGAKDRPRFAVFLGWRDVDDT